MKLLALIAVTTGFALSTAALRAQTQVGSAAALQAAIDNGDTSIVLTANIAVSTPINIGTTSSPTIAINGAGFSLIGTSEIFFIQSGTVTISDATLSGAAKGGNGGNGGMGGGGALGAGGAIFVGGTASVTTSDVTYTGNSATGGNGGANNNSRLNGGGGGGMNGGNGGTGQGASGGGGGNGGSGGSGGQGNGGGGGLNSNGSNSPGGDPGGNGGGVNGGQAGQSRFQDGNSGGLNSGGGGGASLGNGGGGGVNGGGGGGGNGGNRGGSGGDYAGGGGARNTGGNGGFGGGGGGGGTNIGGNGGFGGGGAGTGGGQVGQGGVGGGAGAFGGPANAPGGGGAGLGGAIFVQAGGSMTFTGSQTIANNSVTAGTGANNGAATGNDVFLMTGATVTFAPGTGNTITIGASSDTGADIADDSNASLTSGHSYRPGNGAGGSLVLGSSASSGGTVVIYGNNTFVGGTTVQNSTTLEVGSANALSSSDVTVAAGSSLQITDGITLTNNLTISGNGVNGQGALFNTDNVLNTSTGTITLADDASIDNAGTSQVFQTNGDVHLGSHTLTVSGAGQTVFNGQISGTGGFTVADGSTGTMMGSTANTYAGTTTVGANGFLDLVKSANVISVPGDFNVGGIVFDYFGGQIATTSVVTVSGNGNLLFVNQNLSETIAGLNGTDATALVASSGIVATLTLAGSGTYSYAGQITDDGDQVHTLALEKQGTGTQALLGANSYTGGTTLTAGTLIAGNASALGTGLVQVNGGTLSLGNGVHRLTVGSYTQTAGTLYLTVSGTGASATADQLHVANNAANQVSLGGTLAVDLANFHAVSGTGHTLTFTLVATDAGYQNQFATFNALNQQAGITTSLDYSGNNVLLLVNGGALTFSTSGLTANQGGIANGINTGILSGRSSGSLTRLTTALGPYGNNPAAFGGALDQLSPLQFGHFTSTTAFNNASFATEQRDNYLAGRRSGPNGTFLGGNGSIDSSGLTLNEPSYDPALAMIHSRMLAWNPGPAKTMSDLPQAMLGGMDMKDMKPLPPTTEPWNVFVEGNVILAQGFSQNDLSHFDGNTESVNVGADYRFTPNFLAGIVAGYAHTDATLDNAGSSATVDSYSPGFYASYADHGWYGNLSGSYIHNAYTQSRVIAFLGESANSAPEGNQGVANLDGGYDFHFGALTCGPLAGIQYTHLSVDGYNETGSAADLSVDSQDSDSLRSRLGGRLSYDFRRCGVKLTPHLDASWQHEFLDQSRGITSQFGFGGGAFSVRTSDPSRDSALVSAGLDAEINRTVSLFGNYVVQAGQDNYFGQSIQAGVKIGF